MAEEPIADDPELDATAWDLQPLVGGKGDSGVPPLLDEAQTLADSFAETYAGRVAALDAEQLAAAMHALEAIHDLLGRAGSYAGLGFSTDTADPARGALLQMVEERATAIGTTLLFFDLDWAALDDERAERLLASEQLDFCNHYLRTARRYRPHLLSEPQERILAEKSVTARGAWQRLFEELTSSIEVQMPSGIAAGAAPERDDDERDGTANGASASGTDAVALDVALSRLTSPDPAVRRATAEAVTSALGTGLRTRAFVLNTLLADKATDDRLRNYGHWLSDRNLANEASDESVTALLEAVRGRYEIARRWYRLKARLLGVDRLADYDRAAAVTQDDAAFSWGDARELVLDCYTSFSPELGAVAKRFFDEPWIDAPVRPAKRGGAFCAPTVPSLHPYLLLNYTSRRRDVLTLAHELGHGVHYALSARQGVFHHGVPLTLAETASVFGETIVFGRLIEADPAPDSRLALLAENIEATIATVFRQVAMNRFEDLAHTARREQGELSIDTIGDLWAESQEEMFGDSIEVTPGYRMWWSYIPHFINTPGYVYAYAYGQLLALSVYRQYEERGQELVPKYLEMLAAGGSRSPEELGKIVGVDLTDPGFWDAGLDLVEGQLRAAEDAARATGRVA